MAGKKSNRVEYNQRLLYTAKLIGEGKQRYQIVDILTETYGISIQMADKYIGEVYQSVRENSKDIAEQLITQYNELYQSALQDGNKKLSKEILDSIAKMTIMRDQKLDITTGGQPITTIKIIEVIKENGTES